MGEQFGKVKKTLAILLAVLFVISLTAVATSAAPCKGPMPHCKDGYKASCVNEHWKCVSSKPVCKGPIPRCIHGIKASCVNGYWKCVR
jgi:hypothetical protein